MQAMVWPHGMLLAYDGATARATARVRTTATTRVGARATVRATARCQCLENRVSRCSEYTYRT